MLYFCHRVYLCISYDSHNKLTRWSWSPFWEANSCSATQEIHNILWITVFTRARHWYLSWARWIQSTPPSYFLQIHSNITLLSTSRCPYWSLSLGLPTKTVYAFHFSLIRATYPNNLFILLIITWQGVQVMKILITLFWPAYYLIHFRSKYSPQHPVLKHA
jgi:hypothetical protein